MKTTPSSVAAKDLLEVDEYEQQEEATETVLRQEEALSAEWARV